MNVPRLNRPLVLETPVRTADGAGGYVGGWAALGTLWAEIRPGTGREAAGVAIPLARVPVRIVVRAAPWGDPARPRAEQRFRSGSRVFEISAVTESDADGRYLTCHATEEVAT